MQCVLVGVRKQNYYKSDENDSDEDEKIRVTDRGARSMREIETFIVVQCSPTNLI